MQLGISLAAITVLALAALPAQADELTLTLDSYIGYVAPTGANPDADTCLSAYCALFTGTLMDNDVDPQPDNDPSFLIIGNPYTAASDGTDFDGVLQLDNIAPGGVLSGDTNSADLNPPTSEYGPVFGIDIPVGTPDGVYEDTVYLDIALTNGNPLFTVQAQVTVVVTPEPGTPVLLSLGLAALAAWLGVKRKWPSHDPSQ